MTRLDAGCSKNRGWVPPRLCPGGQTGTSRARRSVAREGTARRARGPPVRYRDKAWPNAAERSFCMPI